MEKMDIIRLGITVLFVISIAFKFLIVNRLIGNKRKGMNIATFGFLLGNIGVALSSIYLVNIEVGAKIGFIGFLITTYGIYFAWSHRNE